VVHVLKYYPINTGPVRDTLARCSAQGPPHSWGDNAYRGCALVASGRMEPDEAIEARELIDVEPSVGDTMCDGDHRRTRRARSNSTKLSGTEILEWAWSLMLRVIF
jgi:hypothetical protein